MKHTRAWILFLYHSRLRFTNLTNLLFNVFLKYNLYFKKSASFEYEILKK